MQNFLHTLRGISILIIVHSIIGREMQIKKSTTSIMLCFLIDQVSASLMLSIYHESHVDSDI